jgi:membrane protein
MLDAPPAVSIAPRTVGTVHRPGILGVVRAVVARGRDDRLTGLAAEVAFYALLGLIPFMLALAAALGWMEAVVGDDLARNAEDEIVTLLQRVLTSEGQGVVDAVRRLFERPAPGALTAGLALVLWLASRSFIGLIRALDVIHQVDDPRGWVRLRLLALGLAVGSAAVIAVLLAALVLDPLLGGSDAVGAWAVLRWPAVAVGVVAWATTLLHLAPARQRPWRASLPGGALGAALGGVVTIGLRVYLAVASDSANAVLGVLGGVLAVVIWFWGLALALLVGGTVDAVLGERRRALE